MTEPSKESHWDSIYALKGSAGVSWYRPHLDRSLQFLRATNLPKDAAIIDVGGGASTFVDDLVAAGYSNVTVLDLSSRALASARQRLGQQAEQVRWLVGDVTQVKFAQGVYDFWHDRAVFHFLREPSDRAAYVAAARTSVKPGGHVVVATFGPAGPERCSGLEVVRYDAEGLHGEFGRPFQKVASANEWHETPWGTEQQFVYCYCRLLR